MKRSLFAPLAVFALAAAILFGNGCGGGGGGSSSNGSGSTNGTDPNLSVQRLVAIPGGGAASDFSNLVEGETVTVRVLSVNRLGVGTLTTPTNVELTAPSSVAQLNGDAITAVGAVSTTYTVRGDVGGRTLSATLRVSPAGSRVPVSGTVRTLEGAAVAGATVRFYGPTSSTVLASVVSGVDGRYRANVSTEATRFGVDVRDLRVSDANNAQTLYYTVYSLVDGLNYDATLGCPAPLPTLSSDTTAPTAVFRRKTSGSTPPPPPDGCAP